MKNTKYEIKNALNEISEIAPLLENFDLDSELDAVLAKLENPEAVMSIYGVYNSGKSTLLNALFRKEVSKMGDVPTTCEIHKFNWKGWTVYDTPGIDAPIEHQEMSDAHIRESECILFVMSSQGDLESEYIYTKIADLSKREKPLLVVVNDKDGILSAKNPEREFNIMRKIKYNISEARKRAGLTGEIPEVILVNAKSAFKAGMENKSILMEKSYLLLLEEKIEAFLKERNEDDVWRTLIIDKITPLVKEIRNQLNLKFNSSEVRELEKIKHSIDRKRKSILIAVERKLRDEINLIISSISQYRENDIVDQLNTELGNLISDLEKFLEEEINNALTDAQTQFVAFIDTEYKDLLFDETGSDETKKKILKIAGHGNKVLKNIPKKHVTKVLDKTGKALAVALEKLAAKTGSKMLGPIIKVLGNLGKYAGPIVTAATTVVDVLIGCKEQQEYENEMKNQARTEAALYERVKYDIRQKIYSEISKSVNEVFDEYLEIYDIKLTEATQAEEEVKAALKKLADIETMLLHEV